MELYPVTVQAPPILSLKPREERFKPSYASGGLHYEFDTTIEAIRKRADSNCHIPTAVIDGIPKEILQELSKAAWIRFNR